MEAIADERGGFKYRLPGVQGYVTPLRKSASVVSPNAAIVREVKDLAFALNVRLPEQVATDGEALRV